MSDPAPRPLVDRKEPPMLESQMSLNHHLNELEQVATDLRAARLVARPAGSGPIGRLRIAVGRALLAAGHALVTEAPTRRVTVL
jgi:hypothetical protein